MTGEKPIKASLDLSAATAADAAAPVDLWNAHLGVQKTPEQWLWQYAAYQPAKAVFAALRAGGRLIATQGMMPFYLKAGPDRRLTAKSENSLILPEYRGTGLMPELYAYTVETCRRNGFAFIWTFTSAAKAFRGFGFSIFPGQQEFILPGGLYARALFAWRAGRPLWRKSLSLANLTARHLWCMVKSPSLNKPCPQKKYRVARLPVGQADLAPFYHDLAAHYPNLIYLPLEPEFVAWRLRRHPFLEYRQYQVEKDGRLAAYAVAACHQNVVRISDLTSLDKQATLLLLKSIVQDHFATAVRFVILLNPAGVLARDLAGVLGEYGFRPQPPDYFVLKILEKRREGILTDMANWHTNGLWTEGFYY